VVTKNSEEKELYKIEVRIPHGYYASIHDLIPEMNKALSKILPYEQQQLQHPQKNKDENLMPRIKYNETSKRMHFVMYRGQSLTFGPALMSLFGLNARQNPSKARDEDM